MPGTEIEHVEVCAADDFATRDRLEEVLAALGYLGNTDHTDLALGPGLSRFRRGEVELSVFQDAWLVDLAGPTDAVQEVLAALSGRDYH